jgi:Na+-driven multidrug efflux pump
MFYAFILFIYYVHKKSYLHLRLKSFHFSKDILKEITIVGFPSTLMLLIISFYVVFLNRAMAYFSVDHVAAFGVVSRLESIAILPVYGLSMGVLTLVGMFYGAKKYHLLEEISWYAIWLTSGLTVLVGIVFLAIPRLLLSVFISDPNVLAVGVPYLMLDIITFPMMAITMIVSRAMQGLGLGMPGLVISLVRVFGVAVPLAYLFVFVLGYGYLSIAVAMILGGAVASVLSLVWLKAIFRKFEKEKDL